MLTVDPNILGSRSGTRVLDIGCGAGRHSFAALERGGRVVAADMSDAVLKDVAGMATAMEREGQVGSGGALACTAADITLLPFRAASFDVVVASEVLEHVPDDARALAEIARVLKPGGVAAVSVPRWWPEAICWALSDAYHSGAGGHVRIYRRSRLARRMENLGLRIERRHHAHALHAPYWWLKAAVGVDLDDARSVRAYHRFLVWAIERRPRWLRILERGLNPMVGKSLVLYARKPAA